MIAAVTLGLDLGPLHAVVENMGVRLTISFPDGGGNLGPAQFDLGFQPPNGVGLTIDAGAVKGGGYLYIDAEKGEYSGPNEYIYQHSNQAVERVTFYSIMESPMTSCGCFECIMVLVPEANGFMVVSREDPSMTPCGMTFSTLAGTAGGGIGQD